MKYKNINTTQISKDKKLDEIQQRKKSIAAKNKDSVIQIFNNTQQIQFIFSVDSCMNQQAIFKEFN